MVFKILDKRTRIILLMQSACMLIGAYTHIKWILGNGIFSPQVNTPFISIIFWDSLAFFDIVAALLLILRPKAGIVLTLIIITIDVIHNNIVVGLDGQHVNDVGLLVWITTYWMLVGQLLFMALVLGTLKSNLREVHYRSAL